MNHQSRTARVCASTLSLLALSLSACGGPSEETPEVTEIASGAIINGTEYDPGSNARIHREFSRKTVYLDTGCTGTLLRPNVVLTARHCVTTNGKPDGTLMAEASLRAAKTRAEASPCSAPTCSTAADIIDRSTSRDIALVVLNNALNGPSGQNWGYFTPLYPYNPTVMKDDEIYITGFGHNKTNGTGAGVLRWGQVLVTGAAAPWPSSKPFLGKAVKTEPLDPFSSGGQLAWSGDSGGPYWVDPAFNDNYTYPGAVIAVHQGRDPSDVAYATRVQDNRAWLNGLLDDQATFGSATLTSGNLSALETVIPSGTSGPPAWAITTSGLKEPSDFKASSSGDGSMLLYRDRYHHNVQIEITAKGSDKGAAGIVFRYVDTGNYYRFVLDEAAGEVRIVKKGNNLKVTLASAPSTAKWSSTVKLKLRTDGPRIRGYVNGTLVLDVNDVFFPVGRVGFVDDSLKDAVFTQFKTTRLTSDLGTYPTQ